MNSIIYSRFYLRCSVVFLLIFISVWVTGYVCMRLRIKEHYDDFSKSKQSNNSDFYGYVFVFLNSFQGIYVFILHCVQNEKVFKLISSFMYIMIYFINIIYYKLGSKGISEICSTTILVAEMFTM